MAGETPTSAATCSPVWRCLRKASTAAQTAGAVWLGDECGLDERSCKPATPPAGTRCLMVNDGHDRRHAPLAIDILGYDSDDVVGRVAKFRHRDRLWMTGIGRDHADKER